MYFAIRDDDTSFFTKIEDLEKAYDFLDEDDCVSLSVVPYTVPIHRDDVFPYGEGIEYAYYYLGDNKELVEYLKEGFKSKKYDLLLHGYSHEYKKLDGAWIAEMKWKNVLQLKDELKRGRKSLESLFDRKINVFVAPNNMIDQKAIGVIEEMGMDYSGIILHNDRKKTIKYWINYIKRWCYRFAFKIPYPGFLDYGKHKELVAYTLDDYDRLVYEYGKCKKRKVPFVIYTHYWQLNTDSRQKDLIKKIYNYAKNDGASLRPLSECYKIGKSVD